MSITPTRALPGAWVLTWGPVLKWQVIFIVNLIELRRSKEIIKAPL
jgi:hypothetical protein